VRAAGEQLAAAAGLHDVKLRVGVSLLEQAGALVRRNDAGGRMQLQLRAGPPVDRAACAAQIEQRRVHKRAQLDRMVEYAEGDQCRRRFVLSYFGDCSAPTATRCCDVCLGSAPRISVRSSPRQPAERRDTVQDTFALFGRAWRRAPSPSSAG
jgi:ATP-dependent DNA helicase RecQ